ncbi:hypothetical protein BX666DRAFT_582187 [Dichotomocladium elegans]|nr:hypothetical protein BX666DRAFT_582187 [Dichotomocladium elegans]
MTHTHLLNGEFVDYAIWREHYYEQQIKSTSLPSLGLDLSLGCPPSLSARPHLEPLPEGTPVSFIDRLTDPDPDQVSAQPSSADDKRSVSSEELDNGTVNEDVWELASELDTIKSEKFPLNWDNPADDTGLPAFLTEQSLQIYEPIYQSFAFHHPSLIACEDQLVESLIQTLCGRPSIFFRWNSDTRSFETRTENLRIIGVSPSALEPYLPWGQICVNWSR